MPLLAVLVAGCDRLTALETHPIGAVLVDDQGEEVARFQGAPAGQIGITVGRSSTYTVRLIDPDRITRVSVDGQLFRITGPIIQTGLRASVSFDPPDRLILTGTQRGAAVLQFVVEHESHTEFTVTANVAVE